MATPAPSNISDPKSPCSSKNDACDHEIQPEKPKEQEESSLKICNDNKVVKGDQTKKFGTSSEEAALQVVPVPPIDVTSTFVGDDSGRERLKRHRIEMAGRVSVPDTWGQENLLKNWVDCTAFDASLVNNTILSARAALVQQRATTRKANHLTLHRRIENRC